MFCRVSRDPDTNDLISPFDNAIIELFNYVLHSGVYPEAWRTALLLPLLKGTNLNKSDPNSYRGISILSSLAQLFATILERRITQFQWSTNQISPVQFGFTKFRRTLDPIFILDTLIDSSAVNKEHLFVAFIDFKKAYDYVCRDGLFFVMLNNGMHGPIFRTIYICINQ